MPTYWEPCPGNKKAIGAILHLKGNNYFQSELIYFIPSPAKSKLSARIGDESVGSVEHPRPLSPPPVPEGL
jgi:hypothetical protein